MPPLTPEQAAFAKQNPDAFNHLVTHPTANIGAFGWLALLGIPILLLFMIYTRIEDRTNNLTQPGAVIEMQPHNAH